MNTDIETRLWEYIDGIANAEECSVIEELIASQQEWREKYQDLLSVNQQLQEQLELDAPSLRFTKNVMEEIGRMHIAPATRSYINKKIIYGIGGFFITLILGFIIYAIAMVDWNSSGSTGGFEWDRIDFSGVFNNQFVNIFMMVNIVLGLMLFDRYLTEQKKQWRKQES